LRLAQRFGKNHRNQLKRSKAFNPKFDGNRLRIGVFRSFVASSLLAVAALVPNKQAAAQAPNPDDSCDPSGRQTCGRLIISMIGAGEPSTDPKHSKDETVRGDRHGREASGHFLQFTANSRSTLPSKHIVLTSDPEVKAWLTRLPFNSKVSLAGVVDASIPAFERMVSPDASDSPLNRALKFFESSEGCKKLTNGGRSVLPYLKVDIVVDGELASGVDEKYHGISVWRKEGTVGTLEKWLEDGTVLGRDELSQLMQRLSGSLVHVFVKTCKAALIGNIFDAAIDDAGSCGCVLNVSDDIQDYYSGGSVAPAFNYAMADKGNVFLRVKISQSFGLWAGTKMNLAEMAPMLLRQHEILLMNPLDSSDPDTPALRNIVQHRNPLFGFAYTSVDALTNKLLLLLQEIPSTRGAAKAIADSEFTFEIRKVQSWMEEQRETIRHAKGSLDHPPASTHRKAATALDADITHIKGRLDSIKKQLGSTIDLDPKGKLNSSVYSREISNFNACLFNEGGAPEYCSVIKALFDDVRRKEKTDTSLSSDELIFTDGYNKFIASLEEISATRSGESGRFSRFWPRYIAGDIDAREFSEKMGEAELAFLKFKKRVEPLYTQKPGEQLNQNGEKTLEKRRQAFAYLNGAFEAAFNSAKTQMFDQLKKESTTTKLLRTEAAVALLAANIDSIEPRSEAEKLVARLASKLNCLTQYKVGPAHDQQQPGPIVPYQAKR
jgi:hypothetical protein